MEASPGIIGMDGREMVVRPPAASVWCRLRWRRGGERRPAGVRSRIPPDSSCLGTACL